MTAPTYSIAIIDENTALITWEDGIELYLALNEGDADLIREGADPVAEGWEDGLGNTVCYENARGTEE